MDYTNLCPGCMEERGASKTCPYCGYEQGTTPASAHHLVPGTLLENKYLLGKVLGQGGFGITYIAWDRKLDMKLAIKEYFPQGMAARTPGRPEVDNSSGELKEQLTFGLQRFLNEAKTLARFAENPNIVTVRDYFEANGTAYLVMSYVEGVTLEQYLRTTGGRISFERCLEIIMPILDALKDVHKSGILHRDISPDNIFINQDGRVVLIDFGAARQEMREKSRSLSVILKAGYAPEEQYRSRGKQGSWTDIYAVAATMYRCITGQTPLEAIDRLDEDDLAPPSKLGVTIDSAQQEALLKALAVRASDRYQTVAEFQEKLLTVLSIITNRSYSDSARIDEQTRSFETILYKSKEACHHNSKIVIYSEEIKKQRKKPKRPLKYSYHKSLFNLSKESRRKTLIVTLIVLCSLIFVGVITLFEGNGETEPRSSKSTPVEGAMIETGLALDASNLILDFSDTFKINQDFYIHFENNEPFEHDRVTLQLVDAKNDQILAQEQYIVETVDHDLYSLVFFSSPGLYRIVAIVGDQIRATREVIIER